MTNADKIRALPDKIIAHILWDACQGAILCVYCPLKNFCGGTAKGFLGWLDWLESEAEE